MKKQIIVVREEDTNKERTWKPFLYEINIEKDDGNDMTITDFYYAEKYSNDEKSFIRDGWDSVDGKLIVVDRDEADYTITEHISWERTYDRNVRKKEKFMKALNDLSDDVQVEEKIIDIGIFDNKYSYEWCFIVNFKEMEILLLSIGYAWDEADIIRNYANCKEALALVKETWNEVEKDEKIIQEINNRLRKKDKDEHEYSRRLYIGSKVREILKDFKPKSGSRTTYIQEIIDKYIDEAKKYKHGEDNPLNYI